MWFLLPLNAAEEARVLGRQRRCCLRLAGEVVLAGITGSDVSHIIAMVQVGLNGTVHITSDEMGCARAE